MDYCHRKMLLEGGQRKEKGVRGVCPSPLRAKHTIRDPGAASHHSSNTVDMAEGLASAALTGSRESSRIFSKALKVELRKGRKDKTAWL